MKFFIIALIAITGTLACEHNGKVYKNGDEWSDRDAFLMTCKIEDNGAWKIELKACIAPDGTKVPINSTQVVKNMEWSCMETSPGSISLRQSVAEKADCHGGHAFESTWDEGSFTFKCEKMGKTVLVSCKTAEGEVPANEVKEFNGITLACNQFANGTVSISPVKTGACRDGEGKKREDGEEWLEKEHFQKKCTDGAVSVVGCKIDQIPEVIPINDKIVKDTMSYHCEESEGSYKFYSKQA